MIFYNGFNLLVDMLVALNVWYFTSKYYFNSGYQAGYEEAEEDRLDFEDAMADNWLAHHREQDEAN